MRRLYPNFKPRGIQLDWEHSSMVKESAGELLRKRWGTPADWGDPVDAVAWFDDDDALRVLIADFANGKRALVRITARRSSITYSKPTASQEPNNV